MSTQASFRGLGPTSQLTKYTLDFRGKDGLEPGVFGLNQESIEQLSYLRYGWETEGFKT